jgi:hypothetical protein
MKGENLKGKKGLKMNEEIMKATGFEKEVKRIQQNLCPFCGEKIRMNSFRDALSVKDYQISGLCQQCQDDFFEEKEG